MDKPLKKHEAEAIIESVYDLIDNPIYKPFYFRRLYVLGADKFLEFAESARKATSPKNKFASDLGRTMKK